MELQWPRCYSDYLRALHQLQCRRLQSESGSSASLRLEVKRRRDLKPFAHVLAVKRLQPRGEENRCFRRQFSTASALSEGSSAMPRKSHSKSTGLQEQLKSSRCLKMDSESDEETEVVYKRAMRLYSFGSRSEALLGACSASLSASSSRGSPRP